jgi:hypothetical protein
LNHCLNNSIIVQTINTISHIIINSCPSHTPIKSFAFATCITHIIHITHIQAHIAIIQLNQNQTNNKPNNAISRKAVGLDILAIVKNNPEIITYFELLDHISSHLSL